MSANQCHLGCSLPAWKHEAPPQPLFSPHRATYTAQLVFGKEPETDIFYNSTELAPNSLHIHRDPENLIPALVEVSDMARLRRPESFDDVRAEGLFRTTTVPQRFGLIGFRS